MPEVFHQGHRDRRAYHRTAAETHDGKSGRHAAAVREPLDQRRNRGDVTQPHADAAQYPASQPHQPELVHHHADAAQYHAATPAHRRDEARFARAGMLQPAAPYRGRHAQHEDEQGKGDADLRARSSCIVVVNSIGNPGLLRAFGLQRCPTSLVIGNQNTENP